MTTSTNVLLIDDDLNVCQALGAALRLENYSVVSATNGREAMRIFAQNKIHIVLLDLNLGLENGWETFQRLIRIEPLIPVIVITAQTDPTRPSSGRPANAVLQKPLDLPLLFQLMKKAVAKASEKSGVPAQSQPVCRALETTTSNARNQLKDLLVFRP